MCVCVYVEAGGSADGGNEKKKKKKNNKNTHKIIIIYMKWIRTSRRQQAKRLSETNDEIWQQFLEEIMFCNLFASIQIVGLCVRWMRKHAAEPPSAAAAAAAEAVQTVIMMVCVVEKATKMPLGFVHFVWFLFFFFSVRIHSLDLWLMVWESFRGQWLPITMRWSPFVVLFHQKCHQNSGWLHPNDIRRRAREFLHHLAVWFRCAGATAMDRNRNKLPHSKCVVCLIEKISRRWWNDFYSLFSDSGVRGRGLRLSDSIGFLFVFVCEYYHFLHVSNAPGRENWKEKCVPEHHTHTHTHHFGWI